MKTLDEVIFEAPYSQTPWEADALHYLMEYKQTRQDLLDGMKRLEGKELMFIHALANLEDNPPLSWEELKTMEGKPIFLEQYWYPMEDEEEVTEDEVEIDKYWAIIDNVQAKRIHFVGKRLIMGMTISDLDPNKSGGWQAYRKER